MLRRRARRWSLFASTLRFDRDAVPEPVELPPIAQLPNSKWGVARRTRSDIGVAEVRRTWEDTPFYARSELASRFLGEEVVTVQESLGHAAVFVPAGAVHAALSDAKKEGLNRRGWGCRRLGVNRSGPVRKWRSGLTRKLKTGGNCP